jgi:hypothetical protein
MRAAPEELRRIHPASPIGSSFATVARLSRRKTSRRLPRLLYPHMSIADGAYQDNILDSPRPLVVAQEPKGDMDDRFVCAAGEPLSGWVAIALAFSLGVLVVIVAAAMRPGIEWLKATASSAGSGLTPTSLAAERCRRVLRAG